MEVLAVSTSLNVSIVMKYFTIKTAPGDYRSASLTLTRTQLQGDGFQVRIPVQDDNVVEATERFMGHLQLTQQSLNLGVVSLGQSMGEVTITDNDGE